MVTRIFDKQLKNNNADNTIAICENQANVSTKHSLAWWIAYFNGSDATIRIPRGTHEVLYDMTIPENICLKFDKGAIIEVADTKTLTINGAIEAGLWQIFSGAGNITGHISNEGIYIEWFGAVPDYDIALKTGTDNASAINKTLTFAKFAKVKATSGAGNFKVDSTVTINCNVDMSQMTIYADGNTVNPVILFGSPDTVDQGNRLKARLPQVINYSKPSNGWDDSSVGIRLASANQCDIDIIYVYGFCHGVLCGGADAGFAYNSIRIQMIYGNKRNLVLCAGFGATQSGWCNENVFYNGRFGFNTSDTTDYTGTRNIVLERVSGATVGYPNNNLFVKPSVESQNIEYSIELAGGYNTFLNGRYEYEGGRRVLLKYNLQNLFIGGYQSLAFTTVEGIEQNQYVKILGPTAEFQLQRVTSNSVAGSMGWEFATFTNKKVFAKNTSSALIDNGTLSLRIHSNETATPDVVVGVLPGGLKGISIDGVPFYSWGGFASAGSIIPRKLDGTSTGLTLGMAGAKWDTVYAVNGTIQTSDERAKTEISAIPDEWLDAWGDVDYTRFKMVDAVQKKGSDNARWHIGIIAQRVKEVFEAHGLDAMQIGLLCYDEWDDIYEDIEVIDSEAVMDEGGNIITPEVKHTETVHSQTAGNLYSIRYDEALTMEAAYMRREVERLKSSINA